MESKGSVESVTHLDLSNLDLCKRVIPATVFYAYLFVYLFIFLTCNNHATSVLKIQVIFWK